MEKPDIDAIKADIGNPRVILKRYEGKKMVPSVKLKDGSSMPRLGMGTWYLGENPGPRRRKVRGEPSDVPPWFPGSRVRSVAMARRAWDSRLKTGMRGKCRSRRTTGN